MVVAVLAVAMAGLLAGGAQARTLHLGDRALAKGSTGHDVRVLQHYLTQVGFRAVVDGRFGSATRRAVRRWERSQALRVNGRVSRRDARVLRASVAQLAPVRALSEAERARSGGAAYVKTERATIAPDGTAVAPPSAPQVVKDVIAAANEIHAKPYRYGGGHGRWKDSGYDCSGSISYALHGGGLLDRPLNSTGFESWGEAGRGTWITVYANAGHAYMVVAGLRFDTSGRHERGSRWTTDLRSADGFVVRHPTAL